ncbi:alpha/beta hydrolase [Streptococcaceae bacterium ESL0729]|nr:alpha/beta hydrolase [Streptococcaceae bacterium ESL0729]
MKNIKKIAVFLTISSILVLVVYGALSYLKKPSYAYNPVPTFYFHGYSGTKNSTASMIAYAQKNYGATKVFTARVGSDGGVTLDGDWGADIDKPLIQVVLDDNTNADMDLLAVWYANVIDKVRREHAFDSYNTVAHSMGNSALQYLLLKEGANEDFPKLSKEVALAAPINGVIGLDDQLHENYLEANGYPKIISGNYAYYLDQINNFPKNQIDILNIYGNLDDGTDSDGSVTTVSAKSLKYLASKYAKSYQEVEIKGEDGQHSKLHENSQVDKMICSFLWQEKE